jgi:hypothetical protein
MICVYWFDVCTYVYVDEKKRYGNLFGKSGGSLYDDKPTAKIWKGPLPKVQRTTPSCQLH